MATYDSIHLETDDSAAVRRALQVYLRRYWWKFWEPRGYNVRLGGAGWTEIIMKRSCMGAGRLTEHLSRELDCRALSLGYQTTAGQEYIRLCEKGVTVRVLWFAPGEDQPYEEQGTPLEFEAAYIEKRRLEAERELAEMDEDLRSDSDWMLSRTSHLPGCAEFAKALGCRSYNRE